MFTSVVRTVEPVVIGFGAGAGRSFTCAGRRSVLARLLVSVEGEAGGRRQVARQAGAEVDLARRDFGVLGRGDDAGALGGGAGPRPGAGQVLQLVRYRRAGDRPPECRADAVLQPEAPRQNARENAVLRLKAIAKVSVWPGRFDVITR